MNNKNEILRKIPQVDELLSDNNIKTLEESIPHDFIVCCIREVIDKIRYKILNENENEVNVGFEYLVEEIKKYVDIKSKSSLRKVINATGVVLHTNFGRAIISKKASNAILYVSNNYSNLEYNIEKGERGDRHSHIEKIITKLTGAEACMVVNNNASATMIVLAALARNKEVVISRGELIEIGGSFRIPDVMSESGCILKEVGTTNKTKLSDYKNALTEETGALLKVHTSNYRIIGFTEEASLDDLVKLGNENNLPVIYDMGNGLFVDLSEYGIFEPTVPNLVKQNADVILFSGDKLLGGPQAGIIIGKKKYIDKMKKHPLARAFRVDKFTIAALYETIFEYFDVKKAKKNIPILNMITLSKKELKEKAENLKNNLSDVKDATILIEEIKDQVGGGTAPEEFLDGYCVSIESSKITAIKLEEMLRKFEIPIIARIGHDKLLIDVRTILNEDMDIVISEIKTILK